MARIELSESEILAELNDARRVDIPDPPGAFVLSEFCRKNKKAERTVREQLRLLDEKGQVETCKVHRQGSDGRRIMVTAYIVRRAPKKARR